MSGLGYRVFYISQLCWGWDKGFSIYHHYVRAGIKDFRYITIMLGLGYRIFYISPLFWGCGNIFSISPLYRGWAKGFSIYHHYVGAGIKDFIYIYIYNHLVGAGIQDSLYITILSEWNNLLFV